MVLVVEDDDQIAPPLLRTLEREGYTVERLAAGLPAVDRVAAGDVDLVLLDLGLPDVDGLEVCRRLRADGYEGGIIILTARGGELDRVVGLDVGADDYLPKPFSLAELLARTRALLRRSGPRTATAEPAEDALEPAGAGGLRVDVPTRRVWAGDREVVLTVKEFDVLALLAADPGAVVTRERIMDEVWDENWFGSTKTLDTTLGRLRQKLEESEAPARIVTVRGVGFRLEDAPADA
ncbi:response regulator transcription factor [Aeromicrobium massiliense]|uniref:response regulator transcription factor n=1 Tax=Aeromicrobium massiliense TaxID=1464554 RepID=UPI0003000DEC|nr:response regulator transcription factor [Aeromicrobium massiliense]